MSAPAIELQKVTVRRGNKVILDAADLALHAGELLALVGPNGSGKSTAVKVMAGALKPDTGTIRYFGRDRIDRQERARLVSYLPQDFRSHWDMTVRELIALGATRGRPGFCRPGGAARGSAPVDLRENLLLTELFDRRLSTLSGGESSRAAVAAAMAGGPKVLLADEPTASLDIAHQLRLMRAIRQATGTMTALLVLHDLNLAARFADRIALMDKGRVARIAAPGEVLGDALVDEVFETQFDRRSVAGRIELAPR